MFDHIAVIGAGVMGTGIARHLAQTEKQVFLVDLSQAQIEAARIATTGLPITCTTDFDVLKNADYIIEAVYEDIQVKRDLLTQVSALCSPSCIIGSNTSSLLISELATAVSEPGRFLGVHYNNPADINPVLEVIPSAWTQQAIADQILKWMRSTGKLAVRCADTSGFILNRQSLPYINEAARCLEVASPGQIDQVATEELGVGLGPFAVMNLVGLKVMAASSSNLSILGAGYAAAATLQHMSQAGDPVWTIEAGMAVPQDVRIEIKDRLLGAMIFPGKDILDQSLCARDDLDMICKQALGYERSSPELLESLPTVESRRLISDYLTRQSAD